MVPEMTRREFMQASAATGAALMVGELWRTAGAADTVQIPAAEKITITVITDNLYDANRPHEKIARRHTISPTAPVLNRNLHAEHGLAYHVEAVVEGTPHALLFDYATDIAGVTRNANLLGLDFTHVEALGLSHGHWDHYIALVETVRTRKGVLPANIPLYVGPEAFIERFTRNAEGVIFSLGQLQPEAITELGFVQIREITAPTPIAPGIYSTGQIEKVTAYETGQPWMLVKRGDRYVADEFVGEQGVVLHAKGKGLVVLSGCAHRGIVNAVKHAQKMTGVDKVHAVMGGFHLIGAKPEVIQQTVADMKAIAPEYIVPTHCTGFEAITAFAREMPDQFILNTAGTRYLITA